MLAYLNYPAWLKPEIFPGLPVRWYGFMYLVAFSLAYILFQYQRKKGALEAADDDVSSFFFWGILGLLLGARLFAVTIYDPSHYYLRKPWYIFWPFNEAGQFVGLQGMSYHGGVVGCIVSSALYCRRKKFSWFQWADLLVAGLPLGYTFGRLGNFINGELWGRITPSGIGMIFPHAPAFALKNEWVREFAVSAGVKISKTARFINLPRHPSQLYEALFEGVVLWLLLWFFFRQRKKFHGFMVSMYLIGYGVIRFFIEYTREPDADIGFPIELVDTGGQIYQFTSFLNFSTGQILCFLMILSGLILYFLRYKKDKGTSKN